jgi:lipopolysaccharide export LptBFGC system permease protein LptF
MTFTVTKTIIAKASAKGRVAGIIIILLVLPFLLLLLVFGILAVIFFAIISPFLRKKQPQVAVEDISHELVPVSNENITITLPEDEKMRTLPGDSNASITITK